MCPVQKSLLTNNLVFSAYLCLHALRENLVVEVAVDGNVVKRECPGSRSEETKRKTGMVWHAGIRIEEAKTRWCHNKADDDELHPTGTRTEYSALHHVTLDSTPCKKADVLHRNPQSPALLT